MKQLRDYTEQARWCRDAAANALSDKERDHLLQMADRWEELARQRAAQLHLEDALADLLKGKDGGNDGSTAI